MFFFSSYDDISLIFTWIDSEQDHDQNSDRLILANKIFFLIINLGLYWVRSWLVT